MILITKSLFSIVYNGYCVCRDYEESHHELLCVDISKFRLRL